MRHWGPLVQGPCFNPLDPTDLTSNMRYFPRISPNSLKFSPEFRANIKIQSPTCAYLLIKNKLFLLHLKMHFVSFNLIYWTPIYGRHLLEGSDLEKYGKMWKNGCFSGGIWSIGLTQWCTPPSVTSCSAAGSHYTGNTDHRSHCMPSPHPETLY